MKFKEELISDKNLKNINNSNAKELTDEIRNFLIENVMKNGGHLASNLGVVELTIALHKVFDFPNDKIIFDVGHQCYVHKILTGRADKFNTLRKLNGLSGFPKVEESNFDCFNTGHASTSISAALGIAKARDINKENFEVIAFIGDGALSGGMAFEALNDAGASKTKLIVVLNDNEMSINQNVGGLSSHLSMLRLGKKYISAKSHLHRFLDKMGGFGNKITKLIKFTKDLIKFAAIEVPLFEELGMTYIGIIDGHNIDELTEAFIKAKNTPGPVLVHTFTHKGKGYRPAEDNPDVYHGVSPKSDNNIDSSGNQGTSYTNIFGKYMQNKAGENDKLVAITAAMGKGCGLDGFSQKYPERFFDVGIAEQHATTFSAGLATRGLIPVFAVYSTFFQRSYDQILHDVCLQNLHVVFAIDRAGVVGEDGETHQGIFDLSYLTHIPNIKILAPSCENEFIHMLDYAIDECNGPVAVRYPKSYAPKREYREPFSCNPELVYNTGDDIVILSVGRMLECSVEASKLLNRSNFGVKVYNVRCIKPFNKERALNISAKTRMIVTIEDNVITGGAGQYITSVLENISHCIVINLGFDDCFVCQGTQEQLFERYNLTADKIVLRIKEEFGK